MFGVRWKKRLNLNPERQFRSQNRRQQLHRDLRQPLRPSRLLHLETIGLHRQLRQAFDRRNVHEFPALELRAITQIGIFGQRVVLPSARVLDHRSPQNPGGSVEVEEHAATRARHVFEHKVPVEQHGLHFRQHIVVAIQIRPASLHHPDLRVGEIVNRALQEIDRRNEIRIEDRHDLAGRRFQTVFAAPRPCTPGD